MKRVATFFFSLLVVLLKAQNLVVNPGFEECKKGLPIIPGDAFASYGINGWYMPTGGTPDWYSNLPEDKNPAAKGFSENFFAGKVDPHSGNSFAGISTYHIIEKNEPGAEYFGGTLNSNLIAGHTYLVSFWYCYSKNSDMWVDTLGFYLSNSKVNQPKMAVNLKFLPQVIVGIDTSMQWTQAKAEYVANGTEQYFCIGNYQKPFEKSATFCRKQKIAWNYAYYYFDDISIVDKNPNGPLTISAGQKLVYNNILFDVGKSTLTASSSAQLDQIVAAMKKQSALKVVISGHTDSDGDAKANQTLSEQRAVSVKKYFVSKGIDSTRITTNGFGSSKPIGNDKSKNRRVEFVFSQ